LHRYKDKLKRNAQGEQKEERNKEKKKEKENYKYIVVAFCHQQYVSIIYKGKNKAKEMKRRTEGENKGTKPE